MTILQSSSLVFHIGFYNFPRGLSECPTNGRNRLYPGLTEDWYVSAPLFTDHQLSWLLPPNTSTILFWSILTGIYVTLGYRYSDIYSTFCKLERIRFQFPNWENRNGEMVINNRNGLRISTLRHHQIATYISNREPANAKLAYQIENA